ncbi:MAG: hypothetical protein AAGF12_25710 [Myxococcota bacterium]
MRYMICLGALVVLLGWVGTPLAFAESSVGDSGIFDAGTTCSCNDQCNPGSVCVNTGFGVPMCCVQGQDGCPSDLGEGILCADGSLPDAGTMPDAATETPREDTDGCSAGGPIPVSSASLMACVLLLFARRRKQDLA